MIDIDTPNLDEIPSELIDEWVEYLKAVNCGLEQLKNSNLALKIHTIMTCKKHPLLLSDLALGYWKKGLNKVIFDVHTLSYTDRSWREYLNWLRFFIYKGSYSYEGTLKLMLDWKENDLEPFLRRPNNNKEWQEFIHLNSGIRGLTQTWEPDKKLSDEQIYQEYIKNARIRENKLTEVSNKTDEVSKLTTQMLQPNLIDGLATAVKSKPKTQQKPNKPSKPKPADNTPSLFSF